MDTPSVLGRIVRHLEAGRLLPKDAVTLVSEDGALPLTYALGTEPFQPGDLVEIRVVRRDGKAGEVARILTAAGRPLGEPVPEKFTADPSFSVDDDPFEQG
jgi:hypothetical protein